MPGSLYFGLYTGFIRVLYGQTIESDSDKVLYVNNISTKLEKKVFLDSLNRKKVNRKDMGNWEIWFEVVKSKLENRLNQGNSRG